MMDAAPDNILQECDAAILTETFLTKEWSLQGFYSINILAAQGMKGRPVGGITCLIKPHLAPFKTEYKRDNILRVKTRLCTLVGAYFQPEYSQEDIINSIGEAMEGIKEEELVVITGDLNCRVDKYNAKSEAVLNYLQEIGMTMVNNRKEKTYVGHNGSSTIDLLLTNMKNVKKVTQEIRKRAARKHLPVETTMEMSKKHHIRSELEIKSREIDVTELERNNGAITEARNMIREGRIDNALEELENIIQRATKGKVLHKRTAKPWFDEACHRGRKEAINTLHKVLERPSEDAVKLYSDRRRAYKKLIQEKKKTYYEEQGKRQIEEAENNPFHILKTKNPTFPRDIHIEAWTDHFKLILGGKDTRPIRDDSKQTIEWEERFTKQEVKEVISNLKKKKACGPDKIYNEQLRSASPMMLEAWADLFNECMLQGTIPDRWRCARIKMLYKGKGDASDMNAYRGIAMECTLYKVMMTLVTRRLTKIVDHLFPEEQFGFRKQRSTVQAIECLQRDIGDALSRPREKLHAVFVDFTKAYDLINRSKLIEKLEKAIGAENPITRITKDILADNRVQVDDNVTISEPIAQSRGVLQGDPMSPHLYNVATMDVIKATETEGVKTYMYADDMVMISRSIDSLQMAINRLVEWADNNELLINSEKTVMMTFRRGGRHARGDIIKIQDTQLEVVNNFKYLGIKLQTQGTTFTAHITDKVAAAVKAMYEIKHLNKVSLKTAMKLFQAKIAPIVTYGLQLIWEHLTKRNLEKLEKVKTTFMKKILCISKYSPTRLTYEMCRETMWIEDLRLELLLPATEAYKQIVKEHQMKKAEIWEEFYITDAMTKEDWKGPNYELRHFVTRYAAHGFHHLICKEKRHHDPGDECVCELCGKQCTRYHVEVCGKRIVSMKKFCCSD